MPSSSLDGETYSAHLLVEDSCGLIGAGPEEVVPELLAGHFHKHHPDVSALIEGVHFTIREAPMRCDVCNDTVELPWWNHVSDPPTHTEFARDADGLWLLCDQCHGFFAADDTKGWLRHVVQVVKGQTTLWSGSTEKEQDLRAWMWAILTELYENLDDGVREELWR